MTQKWFTEAEKALESGDSIEKSYAGKLDGNWGHLHVSKKKLFFVHEKGFFSKKYDTILNTPLSTLSELKTTGTYRMEFMINGSKHVMDKDEIPAKRIIDAINEIRTKIKVKA